MTAYHDPFTLEEAMREIRASRKTIEVQSERIRVLREALEYAVRQVPELATVPGIHAALEATK